MFPTYSDRQRLATRFGGDVARMRACLQAAGKQVEDDDIVYAWADYGDGICASWVTLPASEDELLSILLKHLPSSRLTWFLTAVDAGDGSGDLMLPLPKELLTQMNWDQRDRLNVTRTQSGTLVLERIDATMD